MDKELIDAVNYSADLSKLVEEIKTQEKRFVLIDLDNLNEEDKELIKNYRKNIRTLYTKYGKSDRVRFSEIEKDFFYPAPTNEIEDKVQRYKQSIFDKTLYLKEKFYKKLIFQFKEENIKLLKELQKNINKLFEFNSNKNKIRDIENSTREDKIIDFMDQGEEIQIPIPDDKIKEIFSDEKTNSKEFLSNNEKISEIEMPNLEEVPVKEDIREKEIDDIFDTIKSEDVKEDNTFLSANESVNENELPELKEVTDFKLNDGIIDYDTDNRANEIINKLVSFEQAFKELNLNNITMLTLAFIKEYQETLRVFTKELTSSQRDSSNIRARSIIFGDTPLYFKLGPQSESDKRLESNYNSIHDELKRDVNRLLELDFSNYDEDDFNWLKQFQSRLNLADTFFETKELKKYSL